jgi:3-oxoacyl-[acyl-carrier-protein] synthase II
VNNVVVTGGSALLNKGAIEFSKFPSFNNDEIDYKELLGIKGIKYFTNATKMALAGTKFSFSHAMMEDTETDRGGVILASNLLSIHHAAEFDRKSSLDGLNSVSPMSSPTLLLNAPSSQIAILHNLSGYNTTISSGRTAGIDAIEYAYSKISKGEMDFLIVVGVEELSDYYLEWFKINNLINDDELNKVSEGACVLILESEEYALKRGATIYARILGFSSIFNPEEERDLSTNAYMLNLDEIIKRNNLQKNNIKQICMSDDILRIRRQQERQIIKRYFPDDIKIVEWQEKLGELYGANGVFQSLMTIDSKTKGLSIIASCDWFGNYRTFLIDVEDNNEFSGD